MAKQSKSGEVQCYYIRLHQNMPTARDGEPVNEMYLPSHTKSTHKKYMVDSIVWTPDCVIITAHNEIAMIPLANVAFARPIISA